MEDREISSTSGYGKPPWLFTGRALYQLHLVKSEAARAFIPKQLRLVEAFGYTLGGFFLASYDDSPAGSFDELVVIAGIVWNPPTSCAWAARVLVNSDEACIHGRKEVGLPSQVARFSKRTTTVSKSPESKVGNFLNLIGIGGLSYRPKNCKEVQVSEIKGHEVIDICSISHSVSVPGPNYNKWTSPLIKMSLPSFSGRTNSHPQLLKYSCQLECRVRAVPPANVSGPSTFVMNQKKSEHENSSMDEENKRSLSISVMLSKPILALEFNCMKMMVGAPTVVAEGKSTSSASL